MKIKSNAITQAIFILSTCMLLNGCAIILAKHIAAGAAGASGGDYVQVFETPVYDIEPQVIYRIDKDRYLTLENYPNCDLKAESGFYAPKTTTTYHDDNIGIKSEIWHEVANYKGILINAAKSGKNIGFVIQNSYCGQWNDCTNTIVYSIDYGQTWGNLPFDTKSESKNDLVIITDEAIYKSEEHSKLAKVWKFDTYKKEKSKWIPLLVDKGADKTEFLIKDPKWRNYHVPSFPIKTPSGMERIVCDTNIKPRNVKYVLSDK